MGAVALFIVPKLFPGLTSQAMNVLVDAAIPGPSLKTEWYQVVEGSIYDGDTLRVERGGQELKIRMCGIDIARNQAGWGD